ncbi:hypothetical protein CTAYLR_003093 [Chrysophaeum taylorii]|uniref:NmrA-like domain-containing protein n=1 Tax=Chrysophaeum taylorii TaxID=2483200 RepID=A0AAD7U6G3_9STRA|nr:hypothetical protein CTAYLR_003093 [Chrysophaeum taylorii]
MATVAVMTASSNSGAQCVESLVAAGAPTRAIFRSEEKAAACRAKYGDAVQVVSGVNAVTLDATLVSAFEGATFAVIVTPHYDFAKDAELTCNMIKAASQAGVSHVVFVGSWTVAQPDCTIAKRFVPSETLLQTLPIKWTSLRSGYFSGNYAALFQGPQVFFPDVAVPPVDPKDIGRVAAAICLNPENHDKQFYQISGPEQLTTSQIVEKVSKATGRTFEYHAVPVAALKPPAPPLFLIELLQYIDAHGLVCSPITKELTGIHTSFDDYLAANLQAFMPPTKAD